MFSGLPLVGLGSFVVQRSIIMTALCENRLVQGLAAVLVATVVLLAGCASSDVNKGGASSSGKAFDGQTRRASNPNLFPNAEEVGLAMKKT